MAKRKKAPPHSSKGPKKKTPRAAALPGLEDHAIQALDNVAAQYSDIRDQRMELTRDEVKLKASAMKLMRKYEKTVYRHNGIEIRIVPGEDDIKVKIKPVTEEGAEDMDADDEQPSGGDAVEIAAETLGDA